MVQVWFDYKKDLKTNLYWNLFIKIWNIYKHIIFKGQFDEFFYSNSFHSSKIKSSAIIYEKIRQRKIYNKKITIHRKKN